MGIRVVHYTYTGLFSFVMLLECRRRLIGGTEWMLVDVIRVEREGTVIMHFCMCISLAILVVLRCTLLDCFFTTVMCTRAYRNKYHNVNG